jgi:hypothetical protein
MSARKIWFRSLLCWTWLLLSASGTLSAQEATWKFIVFGDTISFDGSDINSNMVVEMAAEVARQRPAFVLFGGDFSASGSEAALQRWTNLMSPVFQAGINIFPVIGNHDDITPTFRDIFGGIVPANGPAGELGSTYALGYSNALVLVLNEFAPTNAFRVNQAWIDSVLATNTQPHIFAMGHMPAFRLYHQDCLDAYPAERDAFWHSLSNAHCRIYFCGHDHFYDHARIDDGDGNPQNDLHQIIAGTGGAPLYVDGSYSGTNSVWTPNRIFHERQYGYVLVEVGAASVTTTWCHRTAPNTFTPTTETFSYSLRPLPFLRHVYEAGKLTLSWSGTAALQAAPQPTGPFTNMLGGAQSPVVVTNTTTDRVFYRLLLPGP